jgi:hypothetical protein
MFTLQTLETRWFFPGSIPTEMKSWFSTLGTPLVQPPRTDLYLLGAGEALGIKLREGQIEVKKRISQYGETRFTPQICGVVEGWIKWSFMAAQNPVNELLEDGQWLAIQKARQIHYYHLNDNGKIEHSQPREFPACGGGLELTSLHRAGQACWTVGVEVFGPAQTLQAFLANIIQHAQLTSAKISLVCEHSYSYPFWLQTYLRD